MNGDQMREWKELGGDSNEEDAGVHLLWLNGQLMNTLWIEAVRKES